MYMPLMVNLKKVVVLGGERGEGLQKVQKFACFADELLVVPESEYNQKEIVLSPGKQNLLKEDLSLSEKRRIPVAPSIASEESISYYGQGAALISSDLADRELNEFAQNFCELHNILCHIIDTKDLCNTWLMSIIDTPDFQVALTSKGRCAYYLVKAREELTPTVKSMGPWGSIFASLRSTIPPGRNKTALLDKVYHDGEFRNAMTRNEMESAQRRGEEILKNG